MSQNMNYDLATVNGADYVGGDGSGISNPTDCAAKCDEMGEGCFGFYMMNMTPTLTFCNIFNNDPSAIAIVDSPNQDVYVPCGSGTDTQVFSAYCCGKRYRTKKFSHN